MIFLKYKDQVEFFARFGNAHARILRVISDRQKCQRISQEGSLISLLLQSKDAQSNELIRSLTGQGLMKGIPWSSARC